MVNATNQTEFAKRLALIKGGTVMNIIMATDEFAVLQGDRWQAIREATADCQVGWSFDPETDVIRAPVTEVSEPPALAIVVKAVQADPENASHLSVNEAMTEVTCVAGTRLSVQAELQLDGEAFPSDGSFRLPMRASDGRERFLLATMVQGAISLQATMADSGRWMVREAGVNEALPPDQRMRFAGITIFVVEA